MLTKIYTLPIITLIWFGFAVAVQQPVEWPRVDSTEGRFRALMPSKAKPTVSEVDSTTGKTALHTFASSNKIGSFMLSYADYPNTASSPSHAEVVLDKVRDGVLKGTKASLLSETKLTLTGYPGRGMRATRIIDGTEIIFSWRIFLVDKRLYQLAVATTKEDSGSPDINKFFLSFELVNQASSKRK